MEGPSVPNELVHTRQQCLKKQVLQMVTMLMLRHLQGGPYRVVVALHGGRLASGGTGWMQYQQVLRSRRARASPAGSGGCLWRM